MATVSELERKIFDLEEIRVVIRLPRNTNLDMDYDYKRKASAKTTLKDFIATRLAGLSYDSIEVIKPDAYYPSPNMTIGEIREAYPWDGNGTQDCVQYDKDDSVPDLPKLGPSKIVNDLLKVWTQELRFSGWYGFLDGLTRAIVNYSYDPTAIDARGINVSAAGTRVAVTIDYNRCFRNDGNYDAFMEYLFSKESLKVLEDRNGNVADDHTAIKKIIATYFDLLRENKYDDKDLAVKLYGTEVELIPHVI